MKSIVRQDAWLRFAHTDIDKVDKARFSNEERILRFIAFFDNYQEYKGKLADFLNDYMEDKRNISESEIEYYRKIVLSTLELALKINPKITSKNVADAFLVGLAKNIKTLQNLHDYINNDNLGRWFNGSPPKLTSMSLNLAP